KNGARKVFFRIPNKWRLKAKSLIFGASIFRKKNRARKAKIIGIGREIKMNKMQPKEDILDKDLTCEFSQKILFCIEFR
ncbi:MAG: hypothetical protein AAFP00_04660, partial [Bacteroidota bacterium]